MMKILIVIILAFQLLFSTDTSNEKITKVYYEGSKILKSVTKIKNRKKIYTKLYYKNGNLKAEIFFATKEQKANIFKTYDLDGTLTEIAQVRTDTKPNTIHAIKYKNGKKVEEKNEIKIGDKWLLNGVLRIYDDKGTQIKEEHYHKGAHTYTSYCSFDTSKYINKLTKKHLKQIQKYIADDIYCKRLSDDSFDIITMLLLDQNKNISLVVGAIDTKTKKLKFSKFSESTSLGYKSDISIENLTYRAKTDPKVFDIINKQECYQHELCPKNYISYKVAIRKIVQLAPVPFKLKNIVEDVKNGKALSEDLLISILMDEKINSENINTYMELLEYYKQNKEYKSIVILTKNILDRFPNKIELYLIQADSGWSLGEKEKAKQEWIELARYNYNVYLNEMKFLDRVDEVPKRVFERLKEMIYKD